MRGFLGIDDWLKLAAGLLIGLFVLYIAWVFVSNYVSTECWRQTIGPFNDALLGVKTLQAPLGSSDRFTVALNLEQYKPDKHCLQEIYFIRGQYSLYNCNNDCEKGINKGWFVDDKLKSSAVQSCQEDCVKYCNAGKDSQKGCILLMPLPDVTSNVISLNKPKVYGSGDYNFQWDSKWDTLTLYPRLGTSANPVEQCMVFTKLGDGKTYQITPSTKVSDCK